MKTNTPENFTQRILSMKSLTRENLQTRWLLLGCFNKSIVKKNTTKKGKLSFGMQIPQHGETPSLNLMTLSACAL